MTDANEMHYSNMLELDDLFSCVTDENEEEKDSFVLYEELTDADCIPPSLLSYFETSKNRAAVCEKLLLEESADFTASHHSEDMLNLHFELNEDMIEGNPQVICEIENEEDNSSIDTRLLSASTETEALFTHRVSVCLNDEGEGGTNNCMESAEHLTFEMRTLEVSLNDEEREKSIELEAERERQHCEEMKREERKRQIERDFQKELRKIIEAEKLHQKELELVEKKAQEKLEQEFRLQQELIRNLQKQVEEERKMREEEQKKMKDEEEQRKREVEKNKMEAKKKREEAKMKRKKEEERRAEEVKFEEEKKQRIEEEKKRNKEEERNKKDLEKKEREDEMRMIKEEEERKRKEEKERTKREEDEMRMIKEEEERKRKEEKERTKREEDEMRMIKEEEEIKRKEEKERTKREEEEKVKREAERINIEGAMMVNKKEERINEEETSYKKKEEDRKEMEQEYIRTEEVGEVTKEVEERKNQEELRKKEEADERKKVTQEKIDEEMRNRDKRACGSVDEEIKLEESKKREERKEEACNREKERKNMAGQMKEVVRKPEEDITKTKEELRPIKKDERGKREDGRNIKEEEQRRRQKEEMRRQKNEEDCRKSKEERQEVEKRKSEMESKNVEAEKEQNMKKVHENNTEVNKKAAEEIRVTVKEESEIRIAQDREMEVTVVGANEVQDEKEVRENSMLGQKEKNKTGKPENPSQQKDCTPWISSSSVSLHSESAIFPRTEAALLHYDPDKNISQTSTDKTTDCENQAARPSTEFLPEHTEQKRLSWMKNCISWSRLSLQNKRKQKGSVQSRKVPRRPAEANGLPPLCPDSLLQATACRSLQEVTTVNLEDLPGCSLSALSQCTRLQSLSLRRCGLRSLEGINQLSQLCFIDVQENDISFVNCENMTSLRVLRLGHNKLTSIHGLTGAENLDDLDLSYNSITRIAGLESVKRLQRLSVAHNQLISTKGLRDVYTLLHLNCSHNHLANVEGLENSALLNTLDVRANSLTEPPSLNNQVLLRELYLDDNSISSLQSLTACWLPLMQHLSVAQNRITQLPSMSDFVSLENLDLRFNCMSELQNLCKSLEGCQSLRELHLTGNPLQQESGWRSTLQRAVPGLRAIDNQETDSSLSPPAVQQVSLASGSFLTFCRAQLQQIHDLQQEHSRELSEASSSLDAVKASCRHFSEALQLAEEQRFAHEYGDTTVADKRITADKIIPEETLEVESTNAERHTEFPEIESAGKVSPVLLKRDNIRCNDWISEEKSAGENRPDTFDTVTTDPKTGPKVSKSSVHSLETKRKTFSSSLEMAPVCNNQNLDLQNTAAAVVIQQLWRKYRQKCGKISSPSTAERGGGDGGKPESGPSYINESVVGQAYAATVIQAFWRGFALRRKLASALDAVTCSDTGEDDTFEEVDMDGFVLDEAALEKHWTVPLPEDLPSRRNSVLEQPQSVKPPGPFPEPPQYLLQPPPAWRSKQAWVAEGQVDSSGQKVSPVSHNRSKYPASVVGGVSERSEEILEEWGFTNRRTALLMLRRAQNMKSKKQQQCRRREPSVRLAVIRNCSYQLGSVEAEKRQAHNYRKDRKVCEAELRLQQAERTERVKQEGAQQWLQTRSAHSDRDSESGHFLPEINSGVLNGGRVQLVADSGYTQRLHHASGLWANSRSAAQLCRENNYPHRNSLGHARDDVPPPKRVMSAPSKKERISFRDNPVQLSVGWGGGKKRDKVFK